MGLLKTLMNCEPVPDLFFNNQPNAEGAENAQA